ncbi:MAG: hypothetical protein KBC06_00805 [Candidatus Pacebacteria bacterium]|nr:hypothetical protein [Candidatus Paceibacterota bacterium]
MNQFNEPPKNSAESLEGKKAKVTSYLEQALQKAKDEFSDLDKKVSYYTDYKSPSSQQRGPMPSHIERGSADETDWIVETGSDKYESQQKDYFTSHEVLKEHSNLQDRVQEFEEALVLVGQGDEKEIEYWWTELSKPTESK